MRRRSPVLPTTALSLTLVLGLFLGSALPGAGFLTAPWDGLRSALTDLLQPLQLVLATEEESGDDTTEEDPDGGGSSGGLDPGSGGGVMDPNG